jgi:hypothetical protein
METPIFPNPDALTEEQLISMFNKPEKVVNEVKSDAKKNKKGKGKK